MWKFIALALLVPFAAQAGDNNTVQVPRDGKVHSSKDGNTHAVEQPPGGNVNDRQIESLKAMADKVPADKGSAERARAERAPAERAPAERAATEK